MTSREQGTRWTENSRSSFGFTLVELMLALSIAAVLLGLVFSLYFTVSRTVDGQRDRRAGATAMMYALDRLARDLTSALPVPGHREGGFLLETEDSARGPISRVVFCTTRALPSYTGEAQDLLDEERDPRDQRDTRWFEIVEVAYWLEYAPRERGRLMRTERPLVGPEALEPARTNVLAVGVDQFHVRVRPENEWVDAWEIKADDEEAVWPRAARIDLVPDDRARGARPQTVDVLIPTGRVIEPADQAR